MSIIKKYIFILILFVPSGVHAGWGFFGHKKINRVAVFTIPESSLFQFYKENIDFITEHAVDPDKRRYAVKGEAEKHFIDIDHFIKGDGLDSEREQTIGQHIGYRYDVNLVPDYERLTPFLKRYIETMGWRDLNWLEDVHMGYEESRPAVFDRNINGWVTIPPEISLPDNQQDRDMIARELLIKFQMSPGHPMVDLRKAYAKF